MASHCQDKGALMEKGTLRGRGVYTLPNEGELVMDEIEIAERSERDWPVLSTPDRRIIFLQINHRRTTHKLSEQRRRKILNSRFEDLRDIVPACRDSSHTKQTILDKGISDIEIPN